LSLFPLVHVLKANGAVQAPFADFTLCGLPVGDDTSAMWPGEPLRGYHWGKPYRVKGSWCADCRNIEREARQGVCSRCGMKPATPSGIGHEVLCARRAKKEEF
jgi:hypothetical protein